MRCSVALTQKCQTDVEKEKEDEEQKEKVNSHVELCTDATAIWRLTRPRHVRERSAAQPQQCVPGAQCACCSISSSRCTWCVVCLAGINNTINGNINTISRNSNDNNKDNCSSKEVRREHDCGIPCRLKKNLFGIYYTSVY